MGALLEIFPQMPRPVGRDAKRLLICSANFVEGFQGDPQFDQLVQVRPRALGPDPSAHRQFQVLPGPSASMTGAMDLQRLVKIGLRDPRLARSGPNLAGDRQAARSPAGAEDGTLRPPGAGLYPRSGGANRSEHCGRHSVEERHGSPNRALSRSTICTSLSDCARPPQPRSSVALANWHGPAAPRG